MIGYLSYLSFFSQKLLRISLHFRHYTFLFSLLSKFTTFYHKQIFSAKPRERFHGPNSIDFKRVSYNHFLQIESVT